VLIVHFYPYISINNNSRFFTFKKDYEKIYPYLLLAFLINETQKALLGESLLTFKLRQRYRAQNHHMLGCIVTETALSCVLSVIKAQLKYLHQKQCDARLNMMSVPEDC
jgi:hypothetical protein